MDTIWIFDVCFHTATVHYRLDLVCGRRESVLNELSFILSTAFTMKWTKKQDLQLTK